MRASCRCANISPSTYGLILPEIRLTDRADLPAGTYSIRIHGVEHARAQAGNGIAVVLLKSGDENALPPGQDVAEPVYGAPARWIAPHAREQAMLQGATVVAPGRGSGHPPA